MRWRERRARTMPRNGAQPRGEVRVWPVPIVLAVLSALGLVAALLGDGFADVVSWIALGVPLVVVVGHVTLPGARRRAAGQDRSSNAV